jgi:hypothetical protein
MRKSMPVAVTLSTLALVGAAVIALPASQAAPADDAAPQTVTAAAAPVVCNGGASLQLVSRSQVVPFSFAGTSNADVTIPGAGAVLKGPAVGTDTVLVTFSAETYYTGTGWMGLEVWLDGVPMQPYANNGSPYAINSSDAYVGASAQFCGKIRAGYHAVSVKANTTGGAGESGWIDDWTLSIQRFQ